MDYSNKKDIIEIIDNCRTKEEIVDKIFEIINNLFKVIQRIESYYYNNYYNELSTEFLISDLLNLNIPEDFLIQLGYPKSFIEQIKEREENTYR